MMREQREQALERRNFAAKRKNEEDEADMIRIERENEILQRRKEEEDRRARDKRLQRGLYILVKQRCYGAVEKRRS